MKVSGFSFIRNAILYDYPVVEAITSILPVCDEFVIAVGASRDGTLDLIRGIDSGKIRIVETLWDESLREGGRVLADETDKAFRAISPDSDWAFYIQGDECVHENELPAIHRAMTEFRDRPEVEGLLFDYLHFYGSYDFVGDSRKWYRREVRIVRNDPKISSFRDAQGFRWSNRLLHVKHSGGTIYHYGWVKQPEIQQTKQRDFNRFWHDDRWIQKNIPDASHFDYSRIDSLRPFAGTHPLVMQERISRKNWKFNFDPSRKNMSRKSRILGFIEKQTGWRIGEYRNFRLIS
ncbi:MAG: hypothetical protein JW861_00470 [Bacteroidales bacterium]|nr:hypothetical protein [Bacteroidales bacterium]